ncbi:MAG: HD-GYP domain-containing protein [Leptospirillum sp.]|jgi:HD-GYP domain-containing protein (c-di-GMP phosphodiesterase class II)
MKKSIPIDSLKIGMFVCDLDRKWWQTDFLWHQFLIKSQGDIEKLKGAGIQVVMVDLARSEVPVLDLPGEIFDKENVLKKKDEAPKSSLPSLESLSLPSIQDLKSFKDLKERTEVLLQDGFKNARFGKELDVAPFREKIENMIDLISNNPSLITFLMEMEESDDETYRHSVNTMILSLGLAIRKEIPTCDLKAWGLAALFHDIGKTGIPLPILKKTGPLNQSDWKVIQEHPEIGYRILKNHPDKDVSGLCATVAFEHHERKNGSGYPRGMVLDKLSPVTRSMIALDMYEALTANRIYRIGYSPAKTLEILLKSAEDKIDPSAVSDLLKMVGVYPTGSLIETIRGEIVLVGEYTDTTRTISEEVVLYVLKDLKGEWLLRPVRRVKSSLGPKEVKRTLHPREMGLSEKDIIRLIYPVSRER